MTKKFFQELNPLKVRTRKKKLGRIQSLVCEIRTKALSTISECLKSPIRACFSSTYTQITNPSSFLFLILNKTKLELDFFSSLEYIYYHFSLQHLKQGIKYILFPKI